LVFRVVPGTSALGGSLRRIRGGRRGGVQRGKRGQWLEYWGTPPSRYTGFGRAAGQVPTTVSRNQGSPPKTKKKGQRILKSRGGVIRDIPTKTPKRTQGANPGRRYNGLPNKGKNTGRLCKGKRTARRRKRRATSEKGTLFPTARPPLTSLESLHPFTQTGPPDCDGGRL